MDQASAQQLSESDLLNNIKFGRILETAQDYNMPLYANDSNERDKMKIINKFVDKNVETWFKLDTKTCINDDSDSDSDSDEELKQSVEALTNKEMKKLLQEYQTKIKEYGIIKDYVQSRNFLKENQQIIREEIFIYLTWWSILTEMRENFCRSEIICHQSMIIQFIIEQSKRSNNDFIQSTEQFFESLTNNQKYAKQFSRELRRYKSHVQDIAIQSNKEIEENKKRKPEDEVKNAPKKMKISIKSADKDKSEDFSSKLHIEDGTDNLTHRVQPSSFKSSAQDTNEK